MRKVSDAPVGATKRQRLDAPGGQGLKVRALRYGALRVCGGVDTTRSRGWNAPTTPRLRQCAIFIRSKIFPFPPDPNHFYIPRRPGPQRGVSRSSRTLGTGCGGSGGVIEEQRQQRTAKSCGPDASTPASSLREDAQATVTRKPDHRLSDSHILEP